MSLFKIYKGQEQLLAQVPKHEGYAYFCEDTGNFFIDVSNSSRVQINAFSAQKLSKDTTTIEVDDFFLKNMVASVAQGGTGQNTLTSNALIVGNGTNAVKMISLDSGAVAIGDQTNGVKGLLGAGALFADVSGTPKFGTLPITAGGTGAVSAASARTNLSVYSKVETDNKVEEVATSAYTTTLVAADWTTVEGGGTSGETIYTQVYNNTSLKCGKNGNVPPVIMWNSNYAEYNNIYDAQVADDKRSITFYASKKPTANINITVTDIR